MARLSISLLGPFQVTLDEEPVTDFKTEKVQALLAYLAVEADHPHRRDILTGLLWPDQPEEAARNNLRQSLYRLRQAIGDQDASPPFLLITRTTLQFNPDSDYWLDAAAFTAHREATRTHPHRHPETCATCHQRLREAAALYRGDFLQGFFLADSAAFEEWASVRREQFHRQALDVLHRQALYHEKRGEYEAAQQYAHRQLELEPWREEAHRQLMRALALSGQRNAALAQYDACRQILAEGLGVEPAAETTALYGQIRTEELNESAEERALLPPLPAISRHNLPAQATLFIGRETELAQLTRRLLNPGYRLVTLVGEGGVGKTRLALAAAEQVVNHFSHGVWFVPLAGITADSSGEQAPPDQLYNTLATATANALGFTFSGPGEPQAQLLDYLRERELLLLLDNFEHLLEGADFILEVLRSAPHVSVLVTSRERLNFQAEYVMRIEGLPVPPAENDPEASTYASVQLFAERADRGPAGFALGADNQPAVVRVCRLVNGLPLGIELAAAWVERMDCAEIARAIEENLDFLATTLRDVPARHRSLRAVFDQSWRLLSEPDAHILARCAVFHGGFTAEAATAVTQATPAILNALVDRSLLQGDASDRYAMHALLRQFANEKLAEAGGNTYRQIQARHSAYYLSFVAEREDELWRGLPRDDLARLGVELDNVRQAWRWAVWASQHNLIDQAAGGVAALFNRLGLFQAGVSIMQQALDGLNEGVDDGRSHGADQVRSNLLAQQAHFLNRIGNHNQARIAASEAFQITQTGVTKVEALLAWGRALLDGSGKIQEAREKYLQALALSREKELPREQAIALSMLGVISYRQGIPDAAKDYFQQAVEIARAIGDADMEGAVLTDLAIFYTYRGEYYRARDLLEAVQRIAHRLGYELGEGHAYRNLAGIALRLGNYPEAQRYCRTAVTIARRIASGWFQANGMSLQTWLYHNMGEHETARRGASRIRDKLLEGFGRPAEELAPTNLCNG